MSRSREANTIYLTDQELGKDECTHRTHQNPDCPPSLLPWVARQRSGQPSTLDGNPGPSQTANLTSGWPPWKHNLN